MFKLVFFALGWVFALAQLTLGGPSQCLNFGPSSEPGVNKGLGSLLAFSVVCFGSFSFPFRYVLGKSFFVYFKTRYGSLHVSAGDVPLRCITQGAPPFVGPLPPLELVASRPGLGNLAHLRFFDPAHFRAGNIHNKPSIWQGLLDKSPCSEVDLLEVRVDRFFRPFRGNLL